MSEEKVWAIAIAIVFVVGIIAVTIGSVASTQREIACIKAGGNVGRSSCILPSGVKANG